MVVRYVYNSRHLVPTNLKAINVWLLLLNLTFPLQTFCTRFLFKQFFSFYVRQLPCNEINKQGYNIINERCKSYYIVIKWAIKLK